MGMDVYGTNPTKEVGQYYRQSVWGWHPLWNYVENEFPALAVKVEHGHTNDGDGLDSEDSKALAAAMQEALANGTAEQYVKELEAEIAALPDVDCSVCKGTGQRPDGLAGIEWKKPGCNGCSGTGKTINFGRNYGIEVQDIKEFAEFLEHCGGFEIY